MIGIDTNVLLRLLLDDDASQSSRARHEAARAEAADQALFINDIVLVEAVWTLGSRYDAAKDEVLLMLRRLLDNSRLAFENRSVLTEAIAWFQSSSAGFADCLILAKNAAAGCDHTATFDRALRPLRRAKLL